MTTTDPGVPEDPQAASPLDEEALTCEELLRLAGGEGAGNTGPYHLPPPSDPTT